VGARLAEDIRTVRAKDPAAGSAVEILLYPHLHALWFHRLAHALYTRGYRLVARALSQLGRFVSGIEIHPGAVLGRRLFIDHGSGVVIGETARVGDDVVLYHGVTLGSAGWWHDTRGTERPKRHPTIGDHVVLGTGAAVLGPVVIGDGCRIGANAVVLSDLPADTLVPAGAVVRHPPQPAGSMSSTSRTAEGAAAMSHATGQVLITCAPPNPNGDLHLGHLSGPFLGADVLRRYLAARGVPVRYVSYTDDESCYVPRRAGELGETARETAFRFTRRIEQTLSLADMLPDYYAHPHRDPRHRDTVQRHFRALYDAGAIEERTMETPYCECCERFLYEADLRGRCRYCRLPCDGTYCEDCGFPQDPLGVQDARCIRCGERPRPRPTRRLVLPLSTYGGGLRRLYDKQPWSRRVGDFCRELLSLGLPDTPISRVYPYGVPVPLPGWEGHVLDTWFSGIYGYMAATDGLGAALGDPDLADRIWHDQDTTLVHFVGFDCSFSHAVLWPAQMLAEGVPVQPRYIISNEFYQLEGEKFSTSRGHAIWGSDFLREMPADAMRFHLCLTNPETGPTNFARADFDECFRIFLADQLDGWATALFDLIHKAGGTVPAAAASAWPADIRHLVEELPGAMTDALEPATFSLRRAAGAVTAAVDRANRDLHRLRGAAEADGVPGAVLAAHAELLAVVAAVAAPLMPTWSARVWSQLRGLPLDGPPPWPESGARLVASGQQVAERYRPSFAAA
jgi:methionyl-tRNA synthetase